MQCHIPSFSLRAQCASKIWNLEALIRIQMHTDYLLTMTEKLILDRNCIYRFRFGPEITLDACKVNQNDLQYVSIAFCSLSNHLIFRYEAVDISTTTTDRWHSVCICLEKQEENFILCVSRGSALNKKNNGNNIALQQESSVIYTTELMLNFKISVLRRNNFRHTDTELPIQLNTWRYVWQSI